MTEPDVHTLTGPYVLDALPNGERDLFETHLAECDFCADEVGELREAAVKLATQVATPPPPALKPAVMAGVEHTRQLPPLVPGQSTAPVVHRRFGRRSVLTLAAAALAIALSGGIAVDQYRDRSATEQASAQVASVLAQPDAKTVHGSVNGGGNATVVVSTRANKSVVVLKDLPKLSGGKIWQLWLIDNDKTAHSIGLASGDLTQVVDAQMRGMTTFGLTVETKGGSQSPTLPAAALIPLV
jgi:anti-sigma-K factor RskA